MKIQKLIKNQNKNTAKAAAIRNTIAVEVIDAIDSSNAIARVVHARSGTRWTSADEKTLLTSFDAAVLEAGRGYALLNRKQRLDVLRATASDVKRSTIATKIRLKALGKYPAGVRG